MIGKNGPSDSARAAARGGRLRRPAAARHAARCASRALCSGGAPRRYPPSKVEVLDLPAAYVWNRSSSLHGQYVIRKSPTANHVLQEASVEFTRATKTGDSLHQQCWKIGRTNGRILEPCFDPWAVHCENNVPIPEPVVIEFSGCISRPTFHPIPA